MQLYNLSTNYSFDTHSYMQLQVPHDYKVDLPAVDTAAAVIKLSTVSLFMCIKYFVR